MRFIKMKKLKELPNIIIKEGRYMKRQQSLYNYLDLKQRFLDVYFNLKDRCSKCGKRKKIVQKLRISGLFYGEFKQWGGEFNLCSDCKKQLISFLLNRGK